MNRTDVNDVCGVNFVILHRNVQNDHNFRERSTITNPILRDAAMPNSPDATLMGSVADRLIAARASPADRRDAVALLTLIAAGLKPECLAYSVGKEVLSRRLGVDFREWPRILEMLGRAGIISDPRRGGRRTVPG